MVFTLAEQDKLSIVFYFQYHIMSAKEIKDLAQYQILTSGSFHFKTSFWPFKVQQEKTLCNEAERLLYSSSEKALRNVRKTKPLPLKENSRVIFREQCVKLFSD